MKPRMLTTLTFAGALIAVGGADAQSALTAPDRLRTVRIAMSRGEVCFRHEGAGTHLVGEFRRGQRLIATSTGDAAQGDERGQWDTTQERSVSVSWGRGDSSHAFEDGTPFVAPVSGRYTFTYSPTSMLGGRGVFIVCAL